MLRPYYIKKYLVNSDEPKLQIACGERILPGWLNTDIYNGDVFVDATKPLPFPDNTFQYIYVHHFIEHISLDQFESFLDEVYRILRPKGKIRLITPGMKELIEVYDNNNKNSSEVIEYYCKDTTYQHPVEFLNQELRQAGEHCYTYDYDFLKFLLWKHGYAKVYKYKYTETDTVAFMGLDDHGYKSIGEISMCVEAGKCLGK